MAHRLRAFESDIIHLSDLIALKTMLPTIPSRIMSLRRIEVWAGSRVVQLVVSMSYAPTSSYLLHTEIGAEVRRFALGDMWQPILG